MKETVDIFIKTCKKDLCWLRYCLIGIDKFTKGFRQVVIVTEHDALEELNALMEELNLHKRIYPYVTVIPTNDRHYPHGIGYQWQQAVKLSWTDYTNADAVVVMDSDVILYEMIEPECWKRDGKWMWMRRTVEEAYDPNNGYPFGPGVVECLGKETEHDYMCCLPILLAREETIMFQQYLQTKFNMTPYEYLLSEHGDHFSEFITLGAFIDTLLHTHDYVFVHPSEWPNSKPFPIQQYWSWETEDVKEEKFKEIKQLLNI